MNRGSHCCWLARFSLAALLVSSACATASTPGAEDDVDAGIINNLDAAPMPDADIDAAGPMAITMSQTTSPTPVDSTSVTCSSGDGSSENSWYRVFDLTAAGIATDLTVETVTVGVQSSASGNGAAIPVTVRLHTLNGTFVRANLTELASVQIGVADQNLTTIDVNIPATVPGGTVLVAEVFVADGVPSGHAFFIGANSAGQTAPAYLRAPATGCEITEPITTSAVGFPDSHILISVSGTY